MLENWKLWKIFEEKKDHKYYIESIKQDAENLKLIISSYITNPNKKNEPFTLYLCDSIKIENVFDERAGLEKVNSYKVFFNNSIKAYRVFDEHCRLNLYSELVQKYGNDFLRKHNYFIVENSEYIKWFRKNSIGLNATVNLNHFVLMDSETVVEIIATNEPLVEKRQV